jgi:hypothetical protein
MTASRRVAHTATFLQTFHTGVNTADRRAAAGAEGSEPSAPAAPESNALAFVRTGRPAVFAQPTDSGTWTAEYEGVTVTHGDGLLSEAQAKFVVSIALTREGVSEAMLESLKTRLLQGFAKSAASAFISKYKDLPRKAPARIENAIVVGTMTTGHPIPDGRYAIQLPDQDKPHFYSVKHGWKPGVIFVDEQASDDRYPVRNRAAREEILSEICKDPEAAGLRYATELGQCRACGRTLTDHANPYFNMGLGPECGKK